MESTTNKKKTAEMLEELGFKIAASRLRDMQKRKRKLALAYEHYRVVKPAKVMEFNERLKKDTIQGEEPHNATWKRLDFTPIESYPNVPPLEVLETLAIAVGRECFDSFEVAYIAAVKDPILFGRIKCCDDRFFIDQWDDDVKITDLLKDNEG